MSLRPWWSPPPGFGDVAGWLVAMREVEALGPVEGPVVPERIETNGRIRATPGLVLDPGAVETFERIPGGGGLDFSGLSAILANIRPTHASSQPNRGGHTYVLMRPCPPPDRR